MTLRACWLSNLQQWEWKPGCRRDFLFLASGSWWAPGRQHLGQAGLCALGTGISRAGECRQRDIGSIFLFDCADSFAKIAPEIIGLWEHILSVPWKTPISYGLHVWLESIQAFTYLSIFSIISIFPSLIFLVSSSFSCFFSFHPRGRGRDVTWCG